MGVVEWESGRRVSNSHFAPGRDTCSTVKLHPLYFNYALFITEWYVPAQARNLRASAWVIPMTENVKTPKQDQKFEQTVKRMLVMSHQPHSKESKPAHPTPRKEAKRRSETMMEQPLQVVHLKVEQRQGSIYVSSEDMPGLWLWGSDPERVFHDVPIALEKLYKHSRGQEVVAKEKKTGERFVRCFGLERASEVYEIFPVSEIKQDGVNG